MVSAIAPCMVSDSCSYSPSRCVSDGGIGEYCVLIRSYSLLYRLVLLACQTVFDRPHQVNFMDDVYECINFGLFPEIKTRIFFLFIYLSAGQNGIRKAIEKRMEQDDNECSSLINCCLHQERKTNFGCLIHCVVSYRLQWIFL